MTEPAQETVKEHDTVPVETEKPEEDAEPAGILTVIIPSEPGKVEFPVDPEENVYNVMQTLDTIPVTKEYTAYDLVYKGKKLEPKVTFAELGADSTNKDLELTLQPAAYTAKTAREHVVRMRELASLEVPSYQDDAAGVASGASKYGEMHLGEIKVDEPVSEKSEENEEGEKSKKILLSETEKTAVGQRTRVLLSARPDLSQVAGSPSVRPEKTLKSLQLSPWNPVPATRKLQGDLLYLVCQTLEGETYHLTASVGGFFVNQSSGEHFDATERTLSHKLSHSHSLRTLLSSLSSKFDQQLAQNEQMIGESEPETLRLPTNCILSNPWLVEKSEEPKADLGATQQLLLHGGLDAGELHHDFNEEFQALRELPQPSGAEKIMRNQLLARLTFDFTMNATRGAVGVINGEVQPINPEDSAKDQIFLLNGVFFSRAIDSLGQFSGIGGDEAAFAAATRDLEGVRCLNRLDLEGVSHLMTAVVDYCGQRIVCQAPVPGIFNRRPDSPSLVAYGLSEEGDQLKSDARFAQKFNEIGEAFHMKPHKVWSADGSESIDVVTSVRTRGIRGADSRDYILDLYRSTPVDIEFKEKYFGAGKKYPHGEVVLRHEAVQEWWRRQASVLAKAEAEKLEKEGKDANEIRVDTTEIVLNPDAFCLPEAPSAELAAELKADEERVREASKFVGEVLVPEFVSEMAAGRVYAAYDGAHLSSMMHKQGINLRYLGAVARESVKVKAALAEEQAAARKKVAEANVVIAKEEEEQLEDLRKQVVKREARAKAAAAKGEKFDEPEIQQPEVDKDSITNNVTETDVAAIMSSLYNVAVLEMVARAFKHVLRDAVRGAGPALAPIVLVHLHNCLLSPVEPSKPALSPALAAVYSGVAALSLTRAEVRQRVADEVFARFTFVLPSDWLSQVSPIRLVRNVALKFGIQWQNKEYYFGEEELKKAASEKKDAAPPQPASPGKKRAKHRKRTKKETATKPVSAPLNVFSVSDILALTPIVKDSVFPNGFDELWEVGKSLVNKGDINQGLGVINQAVTVCEQIFGAIHPEMARAFGQLADICSKCGTTAQSVALARKAVQISERTFGLDSFETLLQLSQLSLYEAQNRSYEDYLKVTQRILNLWFLSSGENSANIVTTLSSVALTFQRLEMYNQAFMVFKRALEVSDKVHGQESEISGMLHFQLSQALVSQNRMEDGQAEAQKAFEIFRDSVGLRDKSTREARKLAVGISNLLTMTKRQQEYNKQVKKAEAAERAKLEKKKQNKKKDREAVTPDPELSTQNVEDIMRYINGGSKLKRKH